ncbi:ribosomal protein L17 [Kwoniella heveanensis CBS 569]|uniref:Ribosomal protein L17 n=1 Tax=Kwoniella heveanensis BCC8398 TaxID=1296120 RepID=A0A1B9H1N6_9TREE|nr:ribosomal protein L17 [Kwoniella heveanensis BCC8398]OCF46021.1 ribosomal protein L17 [Kwoniella heveanensis CBS 569]
MKHGINQRKLGRMPAHRIALLRNLVSALLHHESIKTTLPKAKEAARMAEKIITLGKKGTNPARSKAEAYLMPACHQPTLASSSASTSASSSSSSSASSDAFAIDPEAFVAPSSLLPKLFGTLSTRYSDRPGGYTRIHKFGRRQGDNAPHAIVTLVDGPRDLKFEMLARTVGKEGLDLVEAKGGVDTLEEGWEGLRDKTKRQVEQALKYRSEDEKAAFKAKAREFADYLQAEEGAYGGHRAPRVDVQGYDFKRPGLNTPKSGRPVRAGERLSGVSTHLTGLGLARGQLARHPRGQQSRMGDKKPRFWGEARLPEGVRAEVAAAGLS